ncbi:MAG: DUF6444 domain-containing protein, partial [Acidobacteriota bacterium]|nr:DUF6444 domain-containing protein [Acidobacteriota bacterium]
MNNFSDINSIGIDKLIPAVKYRMDELILENEILRLQNIDKDRKILELEERLAKLLKNSATSSKPPSSDIVKKKTESKDGKKRSKGAQKGHPRHERSKIPAEEIDNWHCYEFDGCPICGSNVELRKDIYRTFQQIEIKAIPIENSEHIMPGYWCEKCKKMHWPDIPEEIKSAGLFGSQFTALIGYMKYALHASYSCIRSFIQDVLNVKICGGQLSKL